MRIRFTIDITRHRQPAEPQSAPEVDDKGFALIETANPHPIGFHQTPSWTEEPETRRS